MSKSLGNFRLVRDLLKAYPGEVLRYGILSAHYRSDMDFSQKLLEESRDNLDYIYGVLRDEQAVETVECDVKVLPGYQALLDDLNSRQAITEMLAIAKRLKLAEPGDKPQLKGELMAMASVLGLLQQDPEQWFTQGGADDLAADVIEQLIEERLQARADKNFARADEIRDDLKAQGVLLDDYRAEGGGIATKWRRES